MIIVENLIQRYKENGGFREVVRDVSFTLNDDCSYSLVGESGSGKSSLARIISGVDKPYHGRVSLDEKDITTMKGKSLRNIRREVQLVLQDGKSALNARKNIYECIAEPIRNLTSIPKSEEKEVIYDLIKQVQLPEEVLKRRPNELSGGQQKRVCIARAISVQPKYIIFDESVSGLDVTVQKKILDLMLRLREFLHSTYLIITHDIDVALYMSSELMVMKEGKIVEKIHNCTGYADFKSEYAQKLIQSLPPRTPHERHKVM